VSDPRPIRLLLADDRPMLRAGLRTVLGAEPDLNVVAEAGDGHAAVELARRLQPDVVIMDLRLPRLAGVAATRAIAGPAVRVLIVTADDRTESVDGVLRAGARGFLSTHTNAAELVAAIRAVAAGQVVLDPDVLRRLLDRGAVSPAGIAVPAVPAEPGGPTDALTGREREVLVHLARGLSNAEVADRLRVSETTVKTHVGNLLTKLGLRDRVQAVVFAYDTGLVLPGSGGPDVSSVQAPQASLDGSSGSSSAGVA
jgi:DNA-binding NarL/FixJ family response regulator